MTQFQRPNIKYQSESGVILLLSIMVLSGLVLITLSIGSFAIQELRSSRAVAISEPAIVAAEAAGEQGLWSVKRGITMADCSAPSTKILTNNSITSSCKSYDSADFDLKANTDFVFFLYNPENMNGDVDLMHCGAGQNQQCFQNLTIKHVSGSYQVNVTVRRIDQSTTGINPSSTNISPGGSQTVTFSAIPATDPVTEGRIKVVLRSIGNATVNVNTDRGMPTVPTLDVSGCSSGSTLTTCDTNNQEVFTRRLKITVPQYSE